MKNKDQIQELKKQLQILQQKIEGMEKVQIEDNVKDSLIKKTNHIEGKTFYYIQDTDTEFSCEYSDYGWSPEGNETHFADEEQCKRYAEALTTFILLRKQPGSEVANDNSQYIIKLKPWGTNPEVEYYSTVGYKLMNISPCFNSEESARKAIETLGEERILNMFKYFHS